ncbi:transporter substrate-binding domain-containing protein [Robbsia sp. Bb-Pol-6]|uniref:Transporter substrate-binding domain-containing protein n=1 Tax=Robbsia betulipollinis TaxID=2981849 RepID=A0ABT3ZMM5_9BURK|nr:transporter substrate-binding domain-containing protein [Robbsia betulipollinis]MCY0387809.1 transporter substrate-binding domain-containing protein [Robbsia betulipollinis]
MKYRTALLSSVLAGLTLTSAAAHADSLSEIQSRGMIRIAVPQDFPPFGSVDTDMSVKGLDIDVATLIAKSIGVKLDLVPVTSANRIAYLQTHKVDLAISTLGKNAEREKVIAFSQAYSPFNNAVYGAASLKVTGPADLAGQTIGVARSTFEDLQLTATAPATAVIKRYDDNNGMISAYLAGQVQLVGTGDFVANAIAARNPPNKPVEKYVLHESACYVGLNKNEAPLLAKVNTALTAAKKDGALNAIVQKWLHVPMSRTMATTYE